VIGFLLGHLGLVAGLIGAGSGVLSMVFPTQALRLVGAAWQFLSALPKPVFIAACGLLAFLWLRAEGESRHWHKQSDRYEKLYNQEHSGRLADRKAYSDAQAKAAEMNKAQVARVKQQQQEITDATVSRLNSRLELIRGELRKSAPQGSPGSAGAGNPAQAPCRAIDPAWLCISPEERLRAAESEERHDTLIDWVIQQSKVNPNKR
jgi:hypothetical protein